MSKTIEQLKDELEAQLEWKPMKTAPKDGTMILGINKDKEIRVISWFTEYPYTKGTWIYAYNDTEPFIPFPSVTQFYELTRWKPLPDPPKESE